MINAYLEEISLSARQGFYQGFGIVMMAVYLIMLLWTVKQYRTGIKRAIAILVIFWGSYFWANLLCSTLFDVTKGIVPAVNLGVAFGFFLLLAFSLALALRIPVFSVLDAVTPVFILGRSVGILGCNFTGCCHGFPVPWGIYSNEAGCATVPTVLMDSIGSWAITAYLLYTARKAEYTGNGNVLARGLFLFGLLRTAIDILRDNDKLAGMLTFEGFCGILYALAGIVLLYQTRKKKQI